MLTLGAFIAFMFLVFDVYKLKDKVSKLEEKVRELDRKKITAIPTLI